MLSKDEVEVIRILKLIDSEEFLSGWYSGRRLFESELSLINNLRDMGLSDTVVNVLIYYSLIKNEFKINIPVTLRIGKHWIDRDISTGEEAMGIFKEFDGEYTTWFEGEMDKGQVSIIDSIREAIESGLSDEQLGRYVRTILSK